MLDVGKRAPEFSLKDDAGATVKLSELRGRVVVLFFYPEDDTPVCTQQACGFQDAYDGFAELGAVVLGVSPDSVGSHAAFRKKMGFPFRLLSDPGNKVSVKYGSYGEKLMYGKKVQGTIRSSVVIDAEGRIAHVARNVRSAGNGARTLEVVRAMR